MFLSNESTINLATGRRTTKYWPTMVAKKWLPNRRLICQLVCRLPMLAIWTLVVIFLLYNLSASNSNVELTSEESIQSREKIFSERQLSSESEQSPTIRRFISAPDNYHPSNHVNQRSTTNSIKELDDSAVVKNQQAFDVQMTNSFTKQSKVFILLIQDENLRPSLFPTRTDPKHSPRHRTNSKTQSKISSFDNDNHDHHHRLIIPAHIQLLIEILVSHRIDYTLDSTRTGLPSALLTDQDNNGENQQYSVIVIDDFIKYTKLNRWIRDQLDRHCRTNQIGIVTYLTSDKPISHNRSPSWPHQHHSGATVNRVGRYADFLVSDEFHNEAALISPSTTEESLADQFPLTFRPIDQHTCRNASSATTPSSTSSCLFDYQLNENSPILRTLKRKPNFVLPGALLPNLNQSPWITMSSTHITYEPITWARFAQVYDKRRPTASQTAGHQSTSNPSTAIHYSLSPTNTRDKDSRVPSRLIARAGRPLDPPVREDLMDRQTIFGAINPIIRSNESEPLLENGENRVVHPGLEGSKSRGDIDVDQTDSHTHETSSLLYNQSLIQTDNIERQVLSMFDRGLYDGVKRVIFGGANNHWLNRILLLDAIEHLSSGRILGRLDRYIQVDIDDIFVGEPGKRMNSSDVDALIKIQNALAQRIHGGFKFNLGFSGKYFRHGFEQENLGDERLISKAKEFTWFCHTWSHSKAHLFNRTNSIEIELKKNLEFAREHDIPIIGHGDRKIMGEAERAGKPLPPTYAIAPHHSGVYPVHEQLYQAWRNVLNVQVTSTEEYPSLRPASGRRGFVHKTIKVLPRQTCGLYTHTIYRDKYPGGFGKLEASIRGGELFETILHNPVNIYMTHMSNYAHDRLALHTFDALVEFVQANTNLQLKYAPSQVDNPSDRLSKNQPLLGPLKLADYYFNLHPSERQPLWTNPCNDKRHLAIWAPEKQRDFCALVPKLLIVGPQKTGTTALLTFLKINRAFKSSQMSPLDFEEIQFFNDKHYFEGSDWYFNRFFTKPIQSDYRHYHVPAEDDFSQAVPSNESDNFEQLSDDTPGFKGQQEEEKENEGDEEDLEASSVVYFDKSATYFDDPRVPGRARSLLPDARIVIVLVNPADRAYSWYQHMRAHGDSAANSLSFEQLIMTGNTSSEPEVKALRNRCLNPGFYSQHLSRWLDHYPSRQIIIIDGQWFRSNPASVMNKLQLLLRINEPLDYNKFLVFNEQKGFFCEQSGHEVKCLGKSKGRKYPPMSKAARIYLNQLYWSYNRQLARLLFDIGQPLPTWLDETMTSSTSGLLHSSSVIY